MSDNKYLLRYLPLFVDDVKNIALYIRDNLANPYAANNLLDSIESAILDRLPICESFEIYNSTRDRRYPYYRIYVNNFIIFYVVIDDEGPSKIMEVRRCLYSRRDMSGLL